MCGEKYMMKSLKIRTPYQMFSNRRDGRQILGREELPTGGGGKLQRKSLFGRRRHRGEDNIKFVIRKWDGVWNGLM